MALGVGGTVVARARAILEVDTRGYDRGVRKAEAALVRWNRVAVKASLGIVAAFALVGDKSIEEAKKFDTAMELIHTQGGVAQKQVDSLGKSVVDMAASVGTSPETLAAGLYHIASSGLRGAKALDVLRTAAKGAKMGQADLEEVTNALNAVVVSGIGGVKDFDEAMGVLNSTVGAGDMRMEDLAEAFSTGIAAKAQVFGLTLQEISAALATFGDNNIRGAEAGTQLASAIRLLGAPSKASAKELSVLGLKSTTLADDMRNGGLVPALEDLKDRMDKAGLSASQQAALLSRAFGGKQAGGILVLISQLDRLKSKEDEVGEGGKRFGADWKAYTERAQFASDRFHAATEALRIEIGQKLLPTFTALVNVGSATIGVLNHHATAAKIAAGVVGGLAVAVLAVNVAWKAYKAVVRAATIVQAAFNAVADANPIILITAAIVALGIALVVAYKKSATFRRIVNETFTVARKVVADAVWLITRQLDLFLHGLQLLAEGASHLPLVGDKFKGVANQIGDARDNLDELVRGIRGANGQKVKVDVEVDYTNHGGVHVLDPIGKPRKTASTGGKHGDGKGKGGKGGNGSTGGGGGGLGGGSGSADTFELPVRFRLAEAKAAGTAGMADDRAVYGEEVSWIRRRIAQGVKNKAKLAAMYEALNQAQGGIDSIDADAASKAEQAREDARDRAKQAHEREVDRKRKERAKESERKRKQREREAAKHAAGLELPAKLLLREAKARGTKGLADDLAVAKAEASWIRRRIRRGHATVAELTDLYNRLADQKDKVAGIQSDIAEKRKKKGKTKDGTDVAKQVAAANFGFLGDRQSFVSSLAGNMFAPGAAAVGGGPVGAGGATVIVNQTFPAPTADKHREAMYARRAMRAAFE